MSIETLRKAVRNIPDFPIPGIQFKDITTLFQSPEHLEDLSDILFERYKGRGITKVVGIESRGFFMGPAVAIKLRAGFVPIRKPGKLPYKVIRYVYVLAVYIGPFHSSPVCGTPIYVLQHFNKIHKTFIP